MTKYLIAGHGAREYAISKRLKAEGHHVNGVLRKENTNLCEILDGFIQVRDYSLQTIQDAIRSFKTEILFPTDEEAIFSGIGNPEADIRAEVFAPSAGVARLERDKDFSKSLVRQISDELIPLSVPCFSYQDYLSFADTLGKSIVLKIPPPSREVRIILDSDKESAVIREYFRSAKKGHPIIIEEFIEGSEFLLHAFQGNGNAVLSRSIKDYPFRYNNNQGKKTGGMGSVMDSSVNLPDMSEEDYSQASEITRKLLSRIESEFEQRLKGVFSFQFFKSKGKILFNEIDIHPGDPEILCILESMRSSFSGLIERLLSENRNLDLDCSPESVAVKYFVPRYYPEPTSDYYEFQIDEKKIEDAGCTIYWGNSKRTETGAYLTGDSRALAVARRAATFDECIQNIDSCMGDIKKYLDCRDDIGIF
jgi:phosphoribosylamine--glycine ligase